MRALILNQAPLARKRLDVQLYQISRKSSSYQNDEYQFLSPRSNMPTYYFQKSLPRLAIPKPEKTLERYLAAQRPLLSDEEFKRTEGYCNKFIKSGDYL